MNDHPFTITASTGITFAPADGRGGGDGIRLTAKERALRTLERAIDTDSKREQRLEAARRKAIGDTFAAWIEGVDPDLAVEIFAGLEVAASKTNRTRIAGHALRPDGVQDMVEERLAEIEAAKVRLQAQAERSEPANPDPLSQG